MPRLIKARTLAEDTWRYEAEAGTGAVLPPEQWINHPEACLRLSVDAEPEASWLAAPGIAIDFPAFNDGRGLSLAVLLRTRYGYSGELRAIGAVHPEVLHYMERCGFDSYLIPDQYDATQALTLFTPYSSQYQASVTDPQPLYRKAVRGRA